MGGDTRQAGNAVAMINDGGTIVSGGGAMTLWIPVAVS